MKRDVFPCLAFLVLGGTLLVACNSRRRASPMLPATPLTGKFSAQRQVLYIVQDLPKAIAWYQAFFAPSAFECKQATDAKGCAYCSGEVDGITVRLSTNPEDLQLEQAVFYWQLPTAADVDAKFRSLDRDGNRFEGLLGGRLRRINRRRPADRSRQLAPQRPEEVMSFVVKDPDDNRIGVINNPIYVPTR